MIKYEERGVDVKAIVLTTNPECKESFKDCMSILETLAKDKDTRELHVVLAKSKLVYLGDKDEDHLIIQKGNILVEIVYVDDYSSYTMLEAKGG